MIARSSFVLLAALVLAAPQASSQASGTAQARNKQHSLVSPIERPAGLALPLKLVASGEDPVAYNETGAAMEVAGNYLFVGAPGDGGGRVDVWYRAPSGYLFVQQLGLPASIAGQDDRFGRSLATDGGVLVVGTRTGTESGRAVVYRRGGNGLYAFDKVLAPSNGNVSFSFFGERVSVIEDEVIAIAARGTFRVHVFEASAGGVFPSTSTRILDPVNTGTTPALSWMTGFGSTVDLHRTGTGPVRILVGMQDACFYQRTQVQAPDEVTQDPFGTTAARTGGVAVLRKTGGSWLLEQRLIPEYSKMKNFGFELDVDGSRVAVGAIYSRVFSNGFDAGTATVYEWDGTGFDLVKTIWPSFPAQNGWFGYSVHLSGDLLLVGQPYLWGGLQGLVEVFRITGNDLIPVDLVAAPDGNAAANASSLGDSFGREVVCNAYGEVIVSAPFSAPPSGTPPLYAGGALYVYR